MSFMNMLIFVYFLVACAPLTAGNLTRWDQSSIKSIAARIPGELSPVDKIEAGILRLQPKAKDKARTLAKFIAEMSPLPMISVAILMQESGFRDVHVMEAGLDVESHEYRRVYKDLGIAQINSGTALEFRCNVDKLIQHDLKESIRCHSIVLSAKLKLCSGLGEESWTCYNSTTEVHRKAYLRAVGRWLRVIKK